MARRRILYTLAIGQSILPRANYKEFMPCISTTNKQSKNKHSMDLQYYTVHRFHQSEKAWTCPLNVSTPAAPCHVDQAANWLQETRLSSISSQLKSCISAGFCRPRW